ncbi:MAG: helix-turn-helix domain-containing protein [Blastocatellia bacterium]
MSERLSEAEFCNRVGICRMTALRLRKAGTLPYCKVGRKIFYLDRHVDEFYAAVEQNGAKLNAAMNAAIQPNDSKK